MKTNTVWRLPDVQRHTGLSRSTIYEMIQRGEFPRQIRLGRRAVGWMSRDVLSWLATKDENAQIAQRHFEATSFSLE